MSAPRGNALARRYVGGMTPHTPSGRRAQLARAGEEAAAGHLSALGYRVIERNLRIGHDEADLLALTPQGAVAVVEVKARRGRWHPEDRVDATKRANLVRLATALACRAEFRDRLFQFDVVAVSVLPDGEPEVLHWPHAFDAGDGGR